MKPTKPMSTTDVAQFVINEAMEKRVKSHLALSIMKDEFCIRVAHENMEDNAARIQWGLTQLEMVGFSDAFQADQLLRAYGYTKTMREAA